jgi:hypothetical protein
MSAVLICIGFVASSILVSTMLASAWGRNRGWLGYVISTVAVWAAVSTLPMFAPSWAALRFPVDFAHFLANFIALTPFAILPLLFLVPLVVKGVPARKIVITSTVTSIFAVPLSFCSGLVASCAILHDCL